jgi:hypothetical protein
MKINRKINKMFHIGTILLILSIGGLFTIQSALGDTVTPTAPVAKGSGQTVNYSRNSLTLITFFRYSRRQALSNGFP